jgi:8-oxo-dGTP pyrophosphatase MutT (NUDIX family)
MTVETRGIAKGCCRANVECRHISLPMKSGRVSTLVHLVPGGAAVNRVLLRAAYLGARALWFLARPAYTGAVVALWEGDRVVLVHQSYRRAWAFPGGGVGRGETPESAARREVEEELGIALGPIAPALVFPDTYEHRRETVHIFEGALAGAPPRPDGVEIDAVALLTAEEALARNPPPHVRAYLLSLDAGRRVASPA